MIVVIDYGMGNLKSVFNALKAAGAEKTKVTSEKSEIMAASALVLPGVGAFQQALRNLAELALIDILIEFMSSGKPFLGICLGMQLLFSESFESGRHPGLGIIPGRVERLSRGLKSPHMGWNTLRYGPAASGNDPLLSGIPEGAFFYFVHSYHTVPDEKDTVLTVTDHGPDFVSAVKFRNIYGVQFHPEKSHDMGIRMLKNFIGMAEDAG